MIRLESVCEENFNQVIDLKRGTDVADFVDEPIYSLAEAFLYKESSECFAICKGDLVIGFISIYFGEENCQIINFLVDKDFRGRGYGSEAARLSIDYFKENFLAKRISLPVHEENFGAQKFWERLGFKKSETKEDGYVFMRLHL